MPSYDELINELSELCEIVPEYWDIFGEKYITSIETKKSMLRAMRLKIDSVEDILKEINERKYRPWKSFIEPVYVISANDQPMKIPVYIPIHEGEEKKLSLSWFIEDENGQRNESMLSGEAIIVSEQQWIDGIRYIKIILFDMIVRDIGYYVIHVECKHPENILPGGTNLLCKMSKVIVTPDTCYMPPELRDKRTWGLYINLYSIRSSRNWGIGDFADLKKIVERVADLKGSFVGINPLHAIPNTTPFGISPYSPISRLYKNFIYLDIEGIPEVIESEDAQSITNSSSFKEELKKLKKRKLIDYEQSASLKKKILRHAFELFYKKHYAQDTLRGRDFQEYILEEGIVLESFAIFMTLWENMKEVHNVYSWQQWPEEYRGPTDDAVQGFKKKYEKEILFYKYIQWLIDGQLRETAELARELGMVVGLYHDLAIGSVDGGSDVWNYQDVIGKADVGSPPDDFNPNGQNWGFPPVIPERLRETGYELFIQTMRKNMKYGGALRIDHAPGLFRLFWIPYGTSPKEGAYVLYPSEDLLRIIALESVRNKTMIIAEDLGTVGENVRETLKRYQMLSYKLFYFERNYPDPSFILPEGYTDMALCAITTHDLPTIYGYWKCQDLKIRRQLGMYPDDTLWKEQVKERKRDKKLILSVLKSQGIIPDNFPLEPKKIPQMTPELCLAIYQYLAKTPCKLVLVSLDDIIGTLNQQNMPGTVDSYPNWMQKTPPTLEEIISDKRFLDLSEMLRKTFKT
jgi:4-alpha-glucanotransferase